MTVAMDGLALGDQLLGSVPASRQGATGRAARCRVDEASGWVKHLEGRTAALREEVTP